MKKICKFCSNLLILQKIFTKTLLILFLGITNCIILLIMTPLMYIVKAAIGIASYTDEQGKLYCEQLGDLYKSL